jgi:Domain of unknown function (DUF4184)
MPFTPAHPAIVLPLINRKYFSGTALVIGSISPDFEYFFKASVSGVHGHTLLGLLYFDLPVSLALSFVFHLLVKQNLIANLPAFFQRRFFPILQLDFKMFFSRHYGVVIYSALLGAASHIFWDGFTHNGSFFVRNLNIYQTSIPLQGARYPLFYALQHVSTAIGLSAILVYVFLMPADFSYQPQRPRILYWVLLLSVAVIFFAVRFAVFPSHYNLGNAVVSGITALILSLCILGYLKSFRPIAQSI